MWAKYIFLFSKAIEEREGSLHFPSFIYSLINSSSIIYWIDDDEQISDSS